jgi:hypothetical protein
MTPRDIKEIEEELTKTLKMNEKQFPIQFSKDPEKQGMILLNHFQNTETIESLMVLARLKKPGDIAILSRGIFESVLNMGLLLYLPLDKGVDRYRKFISVEALKNYRHLASIERVLAETVYKPSEIADYEKEAKEYEVKYGKPKSSWSGMKVIDICKILDMNYPPAIDMNHFFEFMYCQVYRRGSSVVHRSQLGLLRNIEIKSIDLIDSKQVHSMTIKNNELVFSYFHGLILYIASMRIVGKAFDTATLEEYFQKRIGFLIGGYPDDFT